MMMTYENFKKEAVERFKEFLPDEYAGMSVIVSSVSKVNETLDGLYLVDPSNEGACISIAIYLNYMFEDYLESGDFEGTLEHAADSWREFFELEQEYLANPR